MDDLERQGLTRREMLRKGVITGGAALAWAAPVVTTVGLNSAMAATTSPVVNLDLSYIAINFTCPGSGTVFFSKFDEGGWDDGAGQVASQCAGTGITTANGVDATGKFSANLVTGVVTALGDCTLVLAVGKKGQTCEVL
jgi:hypothetical protein